MIGVGFLDVPSFILVVIFINLVIFFLDLVRGKLVQPCLVKSSRLLEVDPHLEQVGFWQHYDHPTEGELRTMKFPVNFEKSPVSVRRHTPHLGEQTREVLAELGYDTATIETMLTAGAAREKKEVKV